MNRKKVIIAVVVLFLCIVSVIFLVTSPQRNQTTPEEQTNTPTTANEQQDSNAPNTTRTSKQSSPKDTRPVWLYGESDFYTIGYLSSWKPDAIAVTGGGVDMTFKPKDLSNGDVLPAVHIEVTPVDSESTVSNKLTVLAPFRLEQGIINFHGINATTLSGVLFEPVLNDPTKKGVYKSYIFFDKDAYSYTITSAYYLDNNKEKTEQYKKIMTAMLDSFAFK